VNQLCVFRVANLRENARAFRVNQKRALALGLAKIHIREGRGINQYIEIHRVQCSPDITQTGQVKLSVIEASDVVFLSILPQKRPTESSAGAQNHNFHLFRAPMSESVGW
jgi:hypothetical protein